MQPKTSNPPRQGSRTRPAAVKSPRRPVGVQTLGPVRYAQLRQTLLQLTVAGAR